MYYKMTVGKKTYKSFIDWTWIEHKLCVRVTMSAHFRQHKIALVYEIVSSNVPRWRNIIRYD